MLMGAGVLRPGAPTLEEKYGENWTQLRLRPLGFQIFRETGSMSKGGGSIA